MFLANTRQNAKIEFYPRLQALLSFRRSLSRDLKKNQPKKKKMSVHWAELSFVSLSEFHAAR